MLSSSQNIIPSIPPLAQPSSLEHIRPNQCLGITQNGRQCRKVGHNGYCNTHRYQIGRQSSPPQPQSQQLQIQPPSELQLQQPQILGTIRTTQGAIINIVPSPSQPQSQPQQAQQQLQLQPQPQQLPGFVRASGSVLSELNVPLQRPQCSFHGRNGNRCRNLPGANGICHVHQPERVEQRERGRRQRMEQRIINREIYREREREREEEQRQEEIGRALRRAELERFEYSLNQRSRPNQRQRGRPPVIHACSENGCSDRRIKGENKCYNHCAGEVHECDICLEDKKIKVTRCNHELCFSCYDKVDICPFCRSDLREDSNNQREVRARRPESPDDLSRELMDQLVAENIIPFVPANQIPVPIPRGRGVASERNIFLLAEALNAIFVQIQ